MRDLVRAAVAIGAVLATTATYSRWLGITNATIVALTFLLIVLVAAAASKLWVAAATSVVAVLCFNYFFLPPVGTWTIADPQNWVALIAFLAVSLVASNLSSAVRARAQEALDRRDEMARLFDLSRDVLLLTDSREAFASLARSLARRFDLEFAALCLPRGQAWDVFDAGSLDLELDRTQLSLALLGAQNALEFDARQRTYGGHRTLRVQDLDVRLVPLRAGTRPIGLLAAAGRPVDPGTLDALAGVAAIAVERVQFLEERKSAELARQSEELKSALLASLGHDLRTPLTAIRVAANNLSATWLTDGDRRVQSEVILKEVERLNRLFQNILEMARLDAGAVSAERRWVHPAEIVEDARSQVEQTLATHGVRVQVRGDRFVLLDPRLTAAALAHLLENAGQYSPPGSTIDVDVTVAGEGLTIAVRDRGPGITDAQLPHVFDRFYRGTEAKQHTSGTGMGLAIARGLLAAEQGRIWAETGPEGGSVFTIAIPAETKAAAAEVAP
jgi:two-component system sensor histidine kinase KdpD